ncbi:hypothetical protein [Salipiger sp. PrR002]|uniref:hypothetical protein n=1 Tax=Salipiger sp. PrR002 TaxID=2706489 RepID=UPI0013B60D04|nr:hypothetical protein [Salipiger sp. PrR002]NDV99581.1 hypothetical protein [Salipiger sp. PrR002]NDW57227.1 hypothetical protein [Salipiger sp. PrR004]
MTNRFAHTGPLRSRSPLATLVWLVIALAICLSVTIINRTPTAYFDTGLYLTRGENTLQTLGLAPKQKAADESGTADPKAAAKGAAKGNAGADDDRTTSGSRSLFYAVFLASALTFADLRMVPILQACALILTILISVRTIVRRYDLSMSPPALTALAAAGAAMGSAPFYVAFLMPDIFAPILLLVVAGFVAFIADMLPWERAALFVLAAVAVMTHPSHLAIALVLVPPALLGIVLFRRPRKLLAAVMVVGIPLAGLAEHMAVRTAVKTVVHSDVVYTPFLTARLIVDGPGLEYLHATCPNPEVASCALLPMLNEPQRVTPYNILFEKQPDLGSLALLPKETQRQIMAEQVDFAKNVFTSKPLSVFAAVTRNTLIQLRKYSAGTTITEPRELSAIRRSAFDLPPHFDDARLSTRQPWMDQTNTLHAAAYAVSTVLILSLVLWPRSGLPLQLRCWALFLLVGIIANAFVCGAVSQPAARYGARVLFLLPMAAVLLVAVRPAIQSSTAARFVKPKTSIPSE